MQDIHGDALDKIIGDMDDLETKKMYPKNNGATITISVMPGGEGGTSVESSEGATEGGEFPEGHDIALCEGGCAEHKGGGVPKMAEGGEVPPPMMGEEDEMSLPPFLRKKKGNA